MNSGIKVSNKSHKAVSLLTCLFRNACVDRQRIGHGAVFGVDPVVDTRQRSLVRRSEREQQSNAYVSLRGRRSQRCPVPVLILRHHFWSLDNTGLVSVVLVYAVR